MPNEEKDNPFDLLPNELVALILDYLELNDLVGAGCVCRRFRAEANSSRRLMKHGLNLYGDLIRGDYEKQKSIDLESGEHTEEMIACLRGKEREVLEHCTKVSSLVARQEKASKHLDVSKSRLDGSSLMRGSLKGIGFLSLIVGVSIAGLLIYFLATKDFNSENKPVGLVALILILFGLCCSGSTIYFSLRKFYFTAQHKKLERNLERSPLLPFFAHPGKQEREEKGDRRVNDAEANSMASSFVALGKGEEI